MEMPLFGQITIDKKTRQAVRKASQAPCALCGERNQVRVRELVPQKPEMFCVPAGVALFLPLCGAHADVDAITIEAHLLACRLYAVGELIGFGLED